MQIANTVASKALVAVVATAMLFSAFAAPAKAQTAEELQKTINDLMAQIAKLQGGTTTTTGSSASVCPFTWTRDLKTGATGADVKALQQFLNANADTRVAATGVGSTGMETEYFGPATAAAVSKFQVMHRADVLTPAGLTNPTGFFGPGTRAKANALCVKSTSTTTEEEEEEGSDELQGEGTLDVSEVDFDDASDSDLMEGEEDAEIGTLTLAAEDGDIEVSRLDFVMVDNSTTSTTTANESDLWETFDAITLWVDGDMIGEFDASDEDNYLDEDYGTFRISGLDLVVAEDEEVEIVVAATIAGAVDGSDTPDAADWEFDVTDIRYFDADGVASDDPISVDEVVVDIVEEGRDDDATIESNSDTPDAATLKVDEDDEDSEQFDVHVFNIEVDKDSSDLVFNNDAEVVVTVENPTGAATTTIDEVVEAVYLTIDGEEVEGDVANSDVDDTIAPAGSDTATYTFDFGDMELAADETIEATVSIVFKGQDSNYDNGVVVSTFVDGADWDVEGLAGNFDVLTGTDTSEDMTLATVVPVISDVTSETDRNEAGDAGTISFEFTVGADEDDVLLDVANNAAVNGATDDVRFTKSGANVAIGIAQLTKTSGDATFSGGTWTIAEGDEATFVLDVAFTTATGTDNGTYRVTLDTVGGVEVDETSAGMSLTN